MDYIKIIALLNNVIEELTKLEIEKNGIFIPEPFKNIIVACCSFYNINELDFQSKSQKQEIVKCRQMAQYIAKGKELGTLQEIGTYMGNKSHPNVLQGIKTLQNYLDTDKKTSQEFDEIMKIFDKRQ
jgi:chromosomal replication initiation ATPase DnaA